MFLAISCIGYAMPFILCATICCCLPCIVSVLGLREDLAQTRGATAESIDALPTYKFKLKKTRSSNDRDNSFGVGEGGVVAAGTEKERVISGEDAVSIIWFDSWFGFLVLDLVDLLFLTGTKHHHQDSFCLLVVHFSLSKTELHSSYNEDNFGKLNSNELGQLLKIQSHS